MANINLASDDIKQDEISVGWNMGLMGVFILFVVIALASGGVYFWKNKLTKDIKNTEISLAAKRASFSSEKAKNVVDFQNRSEIAQKILNTSPNVRENLQEIEKAMVPEVYLDNYSFDESSKKITLNCVADNYNLVAKQILSFKKSTYFTGVVAGKTSHQLEGKIGFDVTLSTK